MYVFNKKKPHIEDICTFQRGQHGIFFCQTKGVFLKYLATQRKRTQVLELEIETTASLK